MINITPGQQRGRQMDSRGCGGAAEVWRRGDAAEKPAKGMASPGGLRGLLVGGHLAAPPSASTHLSVASSGVSVIHLGAPRATRSSALAWTRR